MQKIRGQKNAQKLWAREVMKRNADIMENEAKRGMRNKKNLRGGEMHGQKSNPNFRVIT